MTRPPHCYTPPLRDGVAASCVALPEGPWPLLLDFLVQRFAAVAPALWRARLAQGLVLDEQGAALSIDAPYRAQARIYYYRERGDEARIPFEEAVLFQDEHLVVADKPHFLPVTPTGRFVQETLLVRLKRKLGLAQLSPIHRIDRETAGLVLFCVRPRDRGAYHALFRQRSVTKEYEAIAPWREDLPLPAVYRSRIEPDTRFFRQREVAGQPNSETQIELLQTQGALARWRLTPFTGKTHQLRVHMNALGRPIVGDLLYPQVVHGPGHTDDDDYRHPLRLLARAIAFTDPLTGQARHFETGQQLNWP